MSAFWLKFLLALAIGKPFFEISESILRNPVTDRCLHVGYNKDIDADGYSVYVDQCTFSDTETGKEGNSDQWLEVVPIPSQAKTPEHSIQKHLSDNVLCIQTMGNYISAGNCHFENSIFIFKPILGLSPSLGQTFTVEQPSGKCLTVQPGNQRLGLNNCSQTNPFQRWVACRHIRSCDVEISWSPSRIVFPKDPFNSTSGLQESTTQDKGKRPLIMLSTPKPSSTTLTPQEIISVSTTSNYDSDSDHLEITHKGKVILNEPIYFIYNSLKMMKPSEKELIEIVSKFYTSEELEKALDILHSEFSLEIDPRVGKPKRVFELVTWIKQISVNSLNSNVIFASEDLSRVPSLFVTNELVEETTSTQGNNNNVCSCFSMQNKVNANLDMIIKELTALKSVVSSSSINLSSPTSSSTAKPSSESDENLPDDDEIMNIDIRIKPSKNKENSQAKLNN